MPPTAPKQERPVPPPRNDLPPATRHITTHTASGSSVFAPALPPQAPVQPLTPTTSAALAYLSPLPAAFAADADLHAYAASLRDPPGLSASGRAVLRTFDIAPGVHSPLHRTQSLDCVVLLHGELEMTLDSGESRVLRPREMVVQRGTRHAWRNAGERWARTLAVVLPAEEVVLGGRALGEDLGGIEGFRDST